MRFTILEEIKSTLPKPLFYNYYSQIKSNQMLVFDERGKPEYPGKNLSWQSRGPTNSIHIWHRVRKSNPGHIDGRQVLSPLGQLCDVIYSWARQLIHMFHGTISRSPFILREKIAFLAFFSFLPILVTSGWFLFLISLDLWGLPVPRATLPWRSLKEIRVIGSIEL